MFFMVRPHAPFLNNKIMRDFCPSGVRNLITKSEIQTAGANATTNNTFTVDKERGDVVAISFTVSSNTIADIDDSRISFSANNVILVDSSPGILYSAAVSYDKLIYRTIIKGGSTIVLTTVNGSANAFFVFVDMYFSKTN